MGQEGCESREIWPFIIGDGLYKIITLICMECNKRLQDLLGKYDNVNRKKFYDYCHGLVDPSFFNWAIADRLLHLLCVLTLVKYSS